MSNNAETKARVAAARRELGALRSHQHKKALLVRSRLGGLLLADEAAYSEALFHLQESLDNCQRVAAPRLQATTLIRYATALQYVGRHQESLKVFDDALAFISERRLRKLSDFALQHKGKCLVETGMFGEAIKCFESALRIRGKRGDEALVRSTTSALAAVRRKLSML